MEYAIYQSDVKPVIIPPQYLMVSFLRVCSFTFVHAARSHSFWLRLVKGEAGQIPVVHKKPNCELRSISNPTALLQYITWIRRKNILTQATAVVVYVKKRNEIFMCWFRVGGTTVLRRTAAYSIWVEMGHERYIVGPRQTYSYHVLLIPTYCSMGLHKTREGSITY